MIFFNFSVKNRDKAIFIGYIGIRFEIEKFYDDNY